MTSHIDLCNSNVIGPLGRGAGFPAPIRELV